MSAKVKVAVRVRPMNKRELDMKAGCVVDMEDDQTFLTNPKRKSGSKTFAFDHCFWTMDSNNPKYADQLQVFQALGMDILHNSFEGYNACIFAYGQTGSGKSYTMMGSLGDDNTKGIIPRLCDTLFDMIAENKKPQLSYKVEVSYMEIYCEKVKDLLSAKGSKSALKVREHKILGPYVESLSKLAVRSFKDINDLMSEGNKSRTVAATQMNTESSRSHAVFSIVLTQTEFDPASQTGTEKVSKISLVDLAGSERVSKTGALGERLKEGSLINKSLTTLGLVISALADISAGKKPRNSYIPYRDSTLTWLLKDNLGGNSKTVMVATISPASDNFEETLSTLRYADRAKRIVNHAVVNEDPNSRVIRELREEVEKLRALIGGGGGGGGGGGAGGGGMGGASTKEINELQDRLRISEGLMSEMTKTWEQRLLDTERIHQERQTTLESMGISVQAAGIGVQVDKFYMVNLNADPSLNELLVCYLKPVTRIGRAQAVTPQDIQLKGLGIANEHCIVEIVDKEVYLTPLKGARTLVNGESRSERVQVKHGGRILLGNNHLYRLSCPHTVGQNGESELMDYEQAMKEISINELTNDPVYSKVQESLLKKHEEEKEGALEAQRLKYEEQLSKLKEQLESSNVTSPVSTNQSKIKYTTIEEEWEQKNRGRLIKSVLQANRLVQEANMLADALHKDTLFKVTLTVPRSFLSPVQSVSASEETTNEVAIRVLHKQRGTDSVWTTDTLEEKVLTMREMYERMEEGGSLLDETIGPDPFYDLEQHALLGVANFYLECVNHGVKHDYAAPIVAPTGKECGKLRVSIQRVPTPVVSSREREEEVDTPELYVQEDCLELGSPVTVEISVVEATGLPKEYSHYVFCQYQFWREEEPMIIPPLVQAGFDKLSDKVQRFDHTQSFTVEMSEEFLDFLEECTLAVEVWGHRRSGFHDMGAGSMVAEESDQRRPKSFPERWSELTKHLELSVEMMELNDQGEYVAVEIQGKPDVSTGGVFMIRQGQSRRINVCIRPVDGLGVSPLKVACISSVSVGSMYLRNRYDEPLDSYQTIDLERLRLKWSDALMNRREYLDAEVRKMMDKREQSVADLEKQNELLDQWAMLQWQRAAVLQPKGGSGVPGAPSNWDLPPGFEDKVPVLFLDLLDDLLTPSEDDPEAAVTTGMLFGEKPDTMIQLPIIISNDQGGQLQATASWDSTVHNTNSLNKITGGNDRVYGIIKVGVTLQHPPGLELVLRKRICLRVYKKIGLGATLIRAFTGRETRSNCGVMFEVVMGIPKSEGMDPPPKIPANPSFVELDEDENAVEKFKTAMTSISNILNLDRLKQDVSLKEKLTASGKSLKKRIAIGDTPQSLSRADSGIVFTGSRADTPEPVEEEEEEVVSSAGVESEAMLSGGSRGEEDTTVGGKVVSLSNGGGGEGGGDGSSDKLKAIPEEALGVGADQGMMVDPLEEEAMQGRQEERAERIHQEEGRPESVEQEEGGADRVQQEVGEAERVHQEEGGAERVHQEEGGADKVHQEEGGAERVHQEEGGAESVQQEVGGADRVHQEEGAAERVGGGMIAVTESMEATSAAEEEGQNSTLSENPETGQSEVIGEELLPGVTGHGDTKEEESVRPENSVSSTVTAAVQLEEVGGLIEHIEVEESSEASAVPILQVSSHEEEPLQVEQVTSPKPTPQVVVSPLNKPPSSPRQDQPLIASPQTSRGPSPTLSTESESSSVAEGSSTAVRRPSPPPCSLRERVMVEMGGGFKMGVVKYIGETEFAPGVEWIGVAFDKPYGKHNGTVKGVKYFKCKEKHGVFVKRDKIIHHPGSSPGSLTTNKSSTATGKPPSPLTSKRKVTSNPQLGRSTYTNTSRRTSLGPKR